MSIDEIIVALSRCSAFSGVADEDLKLLAVRVSARFVAQSEQWLTQGQLAQSLFVLASGEVEAFSVDDNGIETSLSRFAAGECVGEMSYFSGAPRSASMRAICDSELVEIGFPEFEWALRQSASLASNFLSVLTQRLRNTNLLMQDTTRRYWRMQRTLDSLRGFGDMSDMLDMELNIDSLIHQVVHSASEVLAADRATLFLVDNVTGELWSKVAEGADMKEIRFPMGAGVAGWVAKQGKLQNIADAYEDERFNAAIDKKTGYRTRSILCGPVKNIQGQVIGVIQVINKRGAAVFSDEDESLFRSFAYQTAISVENFRLYQRMVSSQNKMALMLDVAVAVTETLNLDELMDRIVSKISEVLRAERSSLFLLDAANNELWAKKAEGAEVIEIRFPVGAGLAGAVAESGEILNIRDAYKDERFNQAFDKATGFRTESVLCMPVRNRDGEIIGVTQAMNKHAGDHGEIGPFDREDEELLQALSSQVAVAIENAKLYESTRAMKNYLESVQESISNGIVTLDNEWNVQTANTAACRLLQNTARETLGADIRELLGLDNAAVVASIAKLYERRKTLIEYDVTLKFGGKSDPSVNINYLPLLDHAGAHQGVILVLEDITQEKRIKSTMTRYMAKDIVERVLADPERQSLGGASSTATILFSDIRSFTGISERYTAQELVRFLNIYFSEMVDAIFANNGVLDKYIGDSIMAVFGVPYEQADDANRAVATAIDMMAALKRLNEVRLAAGEELIEVGIGIASGQIVSGNIGSEKRMEFTVIGDDVNVASRLEGLTKYYGVPILISEQTRNSMGDDYITRPIDYVQVKGKQKPLEIFEVFGRHGDALPLDLSQWQRGYSAYRDGRFSDCMKALAPMLKIDPAARLLSERCADMLAKGINDWNGVWAWDKK